MLLLLFKGQYWFLRSYFVVWFTCLYTYLCPCCGNTFNVKVIRKSYSLYLLSSSNSFSSLLTCGNCFVRSRFCVTQIQTRQQIQRLLECSVRTSVNTIGEFVLWWSKAGLQTEGENCKNKKECQCLHLLWQWYEINCACIMSWYPFEASASPTILMLNHLSCGLIINFH